MGYKEKESEFLPKNLLPRFEVVPRGTLETLHPFPFSTPYRIQSAHAPSHGQVFPAWPKASGSRREVPQYTAV